MKSKTFGRNKVEPLPCSSDEVKKHFCAFAESFIQKNYKDRWKHILLEHPEKAKDEIVKFENHFDARYCQSIEGVNSFLHGEADSTFGIYFDGSEYPFRVSASEADVLSSWQHKDAVFSVVPGMLAIFFHHEGWRWGCISNVSKPNKSLHLTF